MLEQEKEEIQNAVADEQVFFQKITDEMNQDIEKLAEDIEYRQRAVIQQKKYMRDSHGDMDDEEFRQNMQNVNMDTMFVEHNEKRILELQNQMENPYFGKVLFRYNDNNEQLSVYVGARGYWSEQEQDQVIFDWRAPVSSMFYDYGIGAGAYQSPDGELTGEILEKKQFDIGQGKLRNVADIDESVNDKILLDRLSHNSSTKMKSVVATIQKEQNQLIRNTSAYHLVVDGRAGSGKTVIAMHRLAWLLFNNGSLTADRVMILSPNSLFGDYISGILPELGEDQVPEKEFDALMEEILFIDTEYETKLEQSDLLIHIGRTEDNRVKNIIYKSSIEFFDAFQAFLKEYIAQIQFRDFHFEKITFEKEKLEKMFFERFARYPIYERFDKIAYFIADQLEEQQRKEFSETKKQKLIHQIQQEMIYLYAERNLVALYQAFLETLKDQHSGIEQVRNEYGKICYEDILPIFYLQVSFYGCHSYDNIKHLIIDEMQDYSIFQYAVLDKIFKCRKTILGDQYQVLFYNEKETIIDVLKKVFDTGDAAKNFELKTLQTAYRSTKEITQFCNEILDTFVTDCGADGQFPRQIGRSGKQPVVFEAEDVEDAVALICEKQQYGDMDTYDNIAVLCDSEEEAFALYQRLSEYMDVTFITNHSVVYTGGIVVMPKFLAKGMEFDVVFVMQQSDEPADIIHKNAYYISCTRALHELYVVKVKAEDMM